MNINLIVITDLQPLSSEKAALPGEDFGVYYDDIAASTCFRTVMRYNHSALAGNVNISDYKIYSNKYETVAVHVRFII